MKKQPSSSSVALIAALTACAASAPSLADTIETGVSSDGVYAKLRGEKRTSPASGLSKIDGPAQELITVLEEAGFPQKVRMDGVTYSGRKIEGLTNGLAGLIQYRVTFKLADSGEVQVAHHGNLSVVTIRGEAASELMDAMSKAGHSVNGGILYSRTRTRFVDCSAPIRNAAAASCVVSSR